MKASKVRILILVITLISTLPADALARKASKKSALPAGTPVIWRTPDNIAAQNLLHGSIDTQSAPKAPFRFVKRINGGTQPQFIIEDASKVRWIAKLGDEAQPEVVATRLLGAVGYFVDQAFFLPDLRVTDISEKEHLAIIQDENIVRGIFHNVRLERAVKDGQFVKWNWHKNPLIDTREFNGLRVMMALINNWDLKASNNRIDYDEDSNELRFLVHDVGASFGRTGGIASRSKNNPKHYAKEKFIKTKETSQVDLVLKSRPNFFFAIQPVYYRERARMEKVGKNIPIEHARWIGKLLAQLSDQQIRDAFRAAHYSEADVDTFAQALRTRIAELNQL